MQIRSYMDELLEGRLAPPAAAWYSDAKREIGANVSDTRFCALISQASRHAPRGAKAALAPTAPELERAAELLPGWNPERWSTLDALRAGIVLARADLAEPSALSALEEAFRYADMGELCALYRVLPLLPAPERFRWRAGEGCRTNMRAVFEAVACDSPLAVEVFDDIAWNQMVIKCIFIEAPLWRIWGLDTRLSDELARMALDLAEERRSAGRPVQHELWLCLGEYGGERALASLEQELAGAHTLAPDGRSRKAAAIALARAGARGRLASLLEVERDTTVAETMRKALEGAFDQCAFRAMDPSARSTESTT